MNFGSAEGKTGGQRAVAEYYAVARGVFGVGVVVKRVTYDARSVWITALGCNFSIRHNLPARNGADDIVNSRKEFGVFACHVIL